MPVDVVGLSGVTAITAGTSHTCALTRGGGVKCWGNVRGYVSEPNPSKDGASTVPVDISGVRSGATQIAAGGTAITVDSGTCALMSTGAVRCWARGTASVPVRGLPSGVRAIGGGVPKCAVTSSGAITCWESLGGPAGARGSQAGAFTAVTSGAGYVDDGESSWPSLICALTTGGGVKCWGQAGGLLGNGTSTGSTSPVDVAGLTSGVTAVDAGAGHTCAVTSAGRVVCWGAGRNGQLGNGATVQVQRTPVDVAGLRSGVTAVSAGLYHTCALASGGRVKCWGDGRDGQLGNGRRPRPSTTPVDVVFR